MFQPAALVGARPFPLALPGRVNPPSSLFKLALLLDPLSRAFGLSNVRRRTVGPLTRRHALLVLYARLRGASPRDCGAAFLQQLTQLLELPTGAPFGLVPGSFDLRSSLVANVREDGARSALLSSARVFACGLLATANRSTSRSFDIAAGLIPE